MKSKIGSPQNKVPHRKRRGIKRNSAVANPLSLYELRRGRLAIPPCVKPQCILAKPNKNLGLNVDCCSLQADKEKKYKVFLEFSFSG